MALISGHGMHSLLQLYMTGSTRCLIRSKSKLPKIANLPRYLSQVVTGWSMGRREMVDGTAHAAACRHRDRDVSVDFELSWVIASQKNKLMKRDEKRRKRKRKRSRRTCLFQSAFLNESLWNVLCFSLQPHRRGQSRLLLYVPTYGETKL